MQQIAIETLPGAVGAVGRVVLHLAGDLGFVDGDLADADRRAAARQGFDGNLLHGHDSLNVFGRAISSSEDAHSGLNRRQACEEAL